MLGLLAASHLARLDRIVRARFEAGRLFRVPSRVYSAPTILYPGLDTSHLDLEGKLLRLGYREREQLASGDLLPAGSFSWRDGRLRLHRRAFDHPSRAEPPREVLIQLRRGIVDDLRDARSGRALGAVLLEPEPVGSYYGPDRAQRELVRLDELPDHLLHAVLAVEDKRFESHPGIDVRRIVGAALANLRAGGIREGGSTLTQQLVKNFFLTPERTYERKLNEALMALLVEVRYDKASILETYLNAIYLGQRGSTAIHGVGEAARFYFGKAARDLTLSESAQLAAIIQSPGGISPFRDPERARARRDLVLGLMRDQARIEADEHEAAVAEPLRFATVTPELSEGRYFLDALRRELPDVYDTETLEAEGLRIYSTLDVRLQHLAATALREGLAQLEAGHPALLSGGPGSLEGCLVALRPQTGEVLALVGGRDYSVSQFNRCTQARRPAGSVFKPFVYVAALEPTGLGGSPAITLASRLEDAPLQIDTPGGVWEPQNFDRQYNGHVSVREALERSLNIPAARLADRIGIERVAAVAHRLGIESELPEVPSLALGTADLSPLEIARAYATIANGGVRPQIRTFEDVVQPRGGTIARRSIHFERVLDRGTAYLATLLLTGVVDRGTARGVRAAGIAGPLAGKTGTSDRERDAWFVGFTPQLVVAVWVGFDEPRSLGLPGSRAALPIWTRFVREATGGRVRGVFPIPPEVEPIDIDPVSGARALADCPARTTEYFLRGTAPAEVCGRRPTWAAQEPGDDTGGRRPRVRRRGILGWLRGLLE